MPFVVTINRAPIGGASDRADIVRELLTLRAELDDQRTKYTALVALLVAATVLGAGYSAGTTLAAKQFTPT